MVNEHLILHRNSHECKKEPDLKCLRILFRTWQIMLRQGNFPNHTEEGAGAQSVRILACELLVAVLSLVSRLVCKSFYISCFLCVSLYYYYITTIIYIVTIKDEKKKINRGVPLHPISIKDRL